jgi:hypothetical protein
MSRRPVSDHGETRCRSERTADIKKSIVEAASRYTARSPPAITATDGTLFAY